MENSNDPPFILDWNQVKKLGSGGFGTVKLWENRKTGQKVAIKKCHINPNQDPASLQKLKERWNREVLYMTNEIKNENIVQGLVVKPDSFLIELNKTSQLPVLIMEYCEGGDLRTNLNEHRNTSGLLESEVRAVLKCLLSAISYLHGLKISHRDIKPENCVIKTNQNGDKVYKLTDLGYAKAIDRQSLVASLVGTVEYVAPELLITDKYSNSVDYWSFGVIAFEVIAGVRPFVPHLPLAQWMITVKKKKSEHICITEDSDGINYGTAIFHENQISSCFKKYMEEWLKLALEWNPKHRGHVLEPPQFSTNTNNSTKSKSVSFSDMSNTLPPISVLKIFSMLDDILSRKILTMFCLYNYQSYSYEVHATTTMIEFLDWIEATTSIPKDKIRLTVPVDNYNLENINENTLPIELFFDKYFDKPMLFVGYSGMLMKTDSAFEIPESVKLVMADVKAKLPAHILKRFVYNAFYFIRSEQKKYITALDGFYNYSLHLNHQIELYEADINKMVKLIYGLDGAIKLLSRSLERLMQNDEESFRLNQITFTLRDQCQKLQINIGILVGACDKIVKRFRSAHRRSRESINHSMFQEYQKQDYFNLADLNKKFEIIRQQIAAKAHKESQQLDMFKLAYNCLKKRDQLLRGEQFIEWQRQTLNVSIEMEEIKKTVTNAIAQAEKFESEIHKLNDCLIETVQSQQQQHFNGNDYIPDIESILDKKSTPTQKINFQVGQPISWSMNGKTINEVASFIDDDDDENNATSIIEDSEHLRKRIAGVITEIEKEFVTS